MDSSGILSVAAQQGLQRVSSVEEAAEVSAFLLQAGLFGTPLTPGEQEEFGTRPGATLGREDDTYWFIRNAQGGIIGVLGVRMNSERTGIYEVSVLAVHCSGRKRGLGRRLFEFALEFVAARGGRGLIYETSSDPSYAPMRKLLDEHGFVPVGHFPDFYFPGEDALWYYRPVVQR